MKRLIILSFFISALFITPVFGQVPGYMGKRLYVNYDLNFFPAFQNPTYKEENYDFSNKYHGMNMRHGIEVDYVISRTNAIGLSYSTFRSRFEHTVLNDTTQFRKVFPALTCNIIGINYTVFVKSKGAIAPFGTYVKLTGDLILHTIKTDRELIPETTPGTPKLKSFSITFGEQKIYFDRLILDVGAQFGYVQGWMLNDYDPKGLDLQLNAAKRIRNHYAMNVHARIGFLIF